jgi:uncharacterized membrane protein
MYGLAACAFALQRSFIMHPFDIKAALLAKHAQHVVLIHFPIALFLMGFLFDLAAQRTKSAALAAAANYNLVAAALFTIPVFVTGILAWQFALGGHKLKGILLEHLLLACVTTAMLWIIGWVHFRANRRNATSLPACRLPLELLAAALTTLTGHLGGFLSGVNLPG